MNYQHIKNKKSIMMDQVLIELKDLVSSLIIKQTYIADRNETLDMTKAGDEYIAASNCLDVFYSYNSYSEYALNKAGLYELKYRRDKSTIPHNKRDLVVKYQREYILTTYDERNNYYRRLAGLPDIGDEPIYLDEQYEGVDETKPIHLMNNDEITILKVLGVIDRLIKKYPEKKYLEHLENEKRIPIYISRDANDFDILYIKKDRTKQGVSDSFIALYNATRAYVLDRFYDDALKTNSPYYDGFIGMFILCITIQRYITTYFYKFINRDFFNKDIIRMLFDSYGLPFYKNIPLSYFQKVSKNLNRLLYYKATDHVFVDIFKIFDLDNIDIYNYILFKNRKMDINGEPINIYKEKTDVAYRIDTKTYTLIDNNDFYGIKLEKNLDNIRKIIEINDCKLYLLNNGILEFDKNVNTNLLNGWHDIDQDYDLIKFTDNFNITDIYELKGKTYHKVIFITNEPSIFYVFDNKNNIVKYTIDKFIENENITDIGFAVDRSNDNLLVSLNTETKGYLYFKGSICNAIYTDFIQLNIFDNPILSMNANYESIVVVTTNNVPYVLGNNDFNRLHVPFKSYINNWETIENRIYQVNRAYIFMKGTIFVMDDGSVRVTGTVPQIAPNITTPGENEILTEYSSVKCLQTWYAAKENGDDAYFFIEYNGNIHLLNYSIYDRIGKLIYKEDVENPNIRFRFIKNIAVTSDGLMITVYDGDEFVYYSGENENRLFPFIKTLSMIKEKNTMKMKDIEIYNGTLYFITEDNKFVQYTNSDQYKVLDLATDEQIQMFKQAGDYMFITTGKQYFYAINEEEGIIKLDTPGIFVINIYIEDTSIYIEDKNSFIYKVSNLNSGVLHDYKNISTKQLEFTKVEYFECTHIYGSKKATLIPKVENDILVFYLTYIDTEKNINITKKVSNVYNCKQLTINSDRIYIDGKYIEYIDINEFITGKTTEFIYYDEINTLRSFSERVNNHLVIYNKTGGITVFKDFIHLSKLDSYVEGEYISLYDSENNLLKDITFNDTNIIELQKENHNVMYEPVVEKMYDLRFITAPISTTNLSEQFANSSNYLDYELVTYDDKLWGSDGDKNEFINEVLNSEFNYVTSKYISVDCRYNLTKLNFEICYMFKMLTDLKPNEKYLEFEVPYVGKCKLFDVIVAIYQLTCIKLGFEGSIMDTTTKSLFVLGFNFNQDMKYIKEVYDKYNLKERFPEFNLDDVDIEEAPSLFMTSPEVVNLFLNNMDVVQAIYDYKYNTTNIHSYNAMKKIEQATVYTKYSTDMYRREDGTLPESYMQYLLENNPNLWRYVKETDDENMIEQIDNLLVSLDNYLKSDKFKFLFINLPTLSLDNIRRFIYYLVDIFKSYTVDLKGLNIIYDVDDKRIHNIKLILWEDQFLKYFRQYTKYEIQDYMKYILGDFHLYTRIQIMCDNLPDGKMTLNEWGSLFKLFDMITDKIDTQILPLLSDFADEFDRMDEIMGINKRLEIIQSVIYEGVLPYFEKQLIKMRNSDTKEFQFNIGLNNIIDLIFKAFVSSEFYRKDKFKLALADKIRSYYLGNINILNKIFISDVCKPDKLYDKGDIVPFDISDHIELDSTVTMKDRVSMKDTVFFIRSE